MANPVCWFEIYVDDMPRAKQFYQNVLNVTFEHLTDPNDEAVDMWGFATQESDMQSYGATGALVKMESVKAGGVSTLVYFGSQDCAVEADRVEAAGGRLLRAKMSIGEHGFIALAHDTEGNMFGIHSMQ